MTANYDIAAFVGKPTKQNIQAELVKRFVKRRKEQKITQKELSQKSGVTYASVRRFENTGEISLTSLLRLAQTINCLEDFNSLFNSPVMQNLKDYRP